MLVVFQVAVGRESDRRVNLTFGRGFMHAEATGECQRRWGSHALCLSASTLSLSPCVSVYPLSGRFAKSIVQLID
jgi:hypothetical protein